MKNEIFDNMLSRYDLTTEQHKRNAIFEVNQQMILAGLYVGGFFELAAFYGGTCLRIFHGLQRFSEDMDFSLLTQDDKFDFTKYFPAIVDSFAMVGREVEIKKKDKKNFGKVESAFLKDNTDVYDVTFQTEKSIKIKIEVDTCPPLNFKTEYMSTVELQDGTKTIASATFIYDPLFYTSRLVCRQNARTGLSCMEE